MTRAEELQNDALADPRGTLEAGMAYLESLSPRQHSERSITLRAMSLASRYIRRLDDSIAYAREAAEIASEGDLEQLRLMALLTMTGSMAQSGRISEALGLVEETIPSARDQVLLARFRFQRGAMLNDLGRRVEAAETLESVLPVFRQIGDRSSVGLVSNQLGLNLMEQGRLSEAEEYLRESYDLAVELGEVAAIHGMEHNLGQLAAYRGDIPAALEWLHMSDHHFMELSGSSAPQHVTRSVVLASVGLYSEAQALAQHIASEAQRRGDSEHAANAMIVAAEAALSRGEMATARELADATLAFVGDTAGFDRRNAAARRIRNEATLAIDGPRQGLLAEVVEIADEFEESGQMIAASQAYLLAARIARALGEEREERQLLEKVARVSTGPVETRLHAHLARAMLRVEAGKTRSAAAAVRSGLNLLEEYQAALGASDLRAGIELQGTELASIGLGLALDSRRARRVLNWLDRTRARSLRYQPVLPTEDGDTAAALAQLRRVEADLRRPENRDNRDMHRQRRRLQQEIAKLDRVRRQTLTVGPEFSVDGLIDVLGDRTLLEVGQHDGRLFAVLVRRGRARLVDLGDEEKVVNEVGHVRFGMRRAARLGRTPDLASLERLDEMLFGHLDMDGEVIVVPPPKLMAIPWAGLPTLRERPLAVSPSAEMWWRAHQAVPPKGGVLVAGGPDLEFAEAEVEAVAKLYPSPTVLPPGAEVEEVRTSLAGARTAHVVSHASFQVENPMFSALRLGDGDLNLYDIERLSKPPGLVVLSACDSGYTETRAGDELVGLASALLSMGTRSVVASIGLVPDSVATAALMVRFHQGLIGGLQPAAALAAARAGSWEDPADLVAAASFICVGN